MIRTIDDYLNHTTSQHRHKVRFIAAITKVIDPLIQIQAALHGMPEKFDIDAATGVNLDIVGEWIGRTRVLDTPLTGVYFTWSGTAETGWRSGVWRGVHDPVSGMVALPDDAYRTLLRAKIAANNWDGTIPGAYAIWETVFTGSTIFIQDKQDMSVIIGIVGPPLSAVEKALLTGGYIPLKSAGVRIEYYATTSSPTAKMFAWRTQNDVFGGWGEGEWPKKFVPVKN